MIPKRYIEEWKEFAPWPDNSQVEQDLIIERALADLFSDDMIRKNLAFRAQVASGASSWTAVASSSKWPINRSGPNCATGGSL